MSEIVIRITNQMWELLQRHLFQGKLEQGAFLMSRSQVDPSAITIDAADCYLVPPEGWAAQLDVYLEMKDEERGRIMKEARRGGYGVIDIHSHPGSGGNVSFSPSDIRGIGEFATYSKWKLPGQPYIAMVCGESSFDAIAWHGDFDAPVPVSRVEINSDGEVLKPLAPTNSWFAPARGMNRKSSSRRGRTHVR